MLYVYIYIWSTYSWWFWITHNDATQSVGLPWTSDQLVAETSTWQHTTLTTDKYPCPQWDSNPRSQQANGRRPLACWDHGFSPDIILRTLSETLKHSCKSKHVYHEIRQKRTEKVTLASESSSSESSLWSASLSLLCIWWRGRSRWRRREWWRR